MKTRCYGHKGNKNEKLKTPTDFSKQKTQIFALKKIYTSTRVTLNGQITLYLYNSINSSKECACCV